MNVNPPSVTLERRVAAHADELFELLADPGVYEFLDEQAPVSVEALRARFARSESRKSPDGLEHWLNWTVRIEAGHAVGIVQTTIYPNREANVAYVFGSAHRGRGLATTAVQQMLDEVSAGFEVIAFLIVVDARNAASIRLARRLGFTRASEEEGRARALADTDILFEKLAQPLP